MKLSRLTLNVILVAAAGALAACSDSSGGPKTMTGTGGSGATGTGTAGTAGTAGTSAGGAGGASGSTTGEVLITVGNGGSASTGMGGAESCDGLLPATVRDFSSEHPDFEKFLGEDKGIVKVDLGADGKPVYNGNPTTPTTSGQANFDQWYRDVAGVNVTFPISLKLTPSGNGLYTYDNPSYFPIDDMGFGNQGNPHNFHFTTEVHTQFTYKGGEVFKFTGDDDLFAFINKKLVIDLGGVHGEQSASVDLDAVAASIGIVVGKSYPLDMFGAERHTSESHFRIETTISCFTPQPPPQ